jgi:hypothetical protein
MTTYAAGLRVSEVVNLKLADIDSKRLMIRVPPSAPNAGASFIDKIFSYLFYIYLCPTSCAHPVAKPALRSTDFESMVRTHVVHC